MSNITLIGAGKAASSLFKALTDAEYKIEMIVSRSIHSAKELASKSDGCSYSAELKDVLSSDLIFICVNDGEIENTVDRILELGRDLSGKTFVHLSGAHNISLLSGLDERKACTASFHIMQTFPSKKPVEIKGCYAAVESEDEITASGLFELAENLGLRPFRISSEGKVYYHLMGVFASNFLVSNYYDADNLFSMTWNKDIDAGRLLIPIIERTLKNCTEKGAAAALSGPVERGDIETINHHVEALRNDKHLLLNYLSGSLNLLEISFKKGSITREKFIEIEQYLKNELQKCVSLNFV